MSRETISKVLFSLLFMVASTTASIAQDGAYSGFSPYTIYGVGDLTNKGAAYNRSMGGVGIAQRNYRFINYLNPAAVTARDSLSVLADMSLSQNNILFSQNGMHTVQNMFNINDIVVSFPIYKSCAAMLGITPYSSTGYKYTTPLTGVDYAAVTGTGNNTAYGQGSIYEVFAGLGLQPFKWWSVGADVIYYFGTVDKTSSLTFSKSSAYNRTLKTTVVPRATTAKVGTQFDIPLSKKSNLVLGATYKFSAQVSGESNSYNTYSGSYASVTDTVKTDLSGVRFGDELGFGVSYNFSDKLTIEADYIRTNWADSNMDNVRGLGIQGLYNTFTSSYGESIRGGFEYVPNRNDIRYFMRRCTYRAGAYYDKSYYRIDGNPMHALGVTFGMGIPVFRWANSINVGMELGRRTSFQTGLISESFVNFTIGFSVFDYWFMKHRYE